MPTVEGRDVGGVDGVQEVARREDSLRAGAQRGVDERAEVALIDVDAPQSGELVVRNPVAGEHDGVAVDDAPLPRAEILDLDPRHPISTQHPHHPRASREWDPQRQPPRHRERGVRVCPGVLGRHQRRAAPRLAQGEHRRPAHQLTADDDRALAHLAPLEVHERLELARGEHPGRPVARNAPRGPGSLAGAGGVSACRGGFCVAAVAIARSLSPFDRE